MSGTMLGDANPLTLVILSEAKNQVGRDNALCRSRFLRRLILRFAQNDKGEKALYSRHHFVGRVLADALLADSKVIEIEGEDRMGQIVSGEQKHWHGYHILARKVIAIP